MSGDDRLLVLSSVAHLYIVYASTGGPEILHGCVSSGWPIAFRYALHVYWRAPTFGTAAFVSLTHGFATRTDTRCVEVG